MSKLFGYYDPKTNATYHWVFSDTLAAKMVFQFLLLSGGLSFEDAWRALNHEGVYSLMLAHRLNNDKEVPTDFHYGPLRLVINHLGQGTEDDPYVVTPSIDFEELARMGAQAREDENGDNTPLGWFARSADVHTMIDTAGVEANPLQLFHPDRTEAMDYSALHRLSRVLSYWDVPVGERSDVEPVSAIVQYVAELARVALINAKGGNLRQDQAAKLEAMGYRFVTRTGSPSLNVWLVTKTRGLVRLCGTDDVILDGITLKGEDVYLSPKEVAARMTARLAAYAAIKFGEVEGSITVVEGAGAVQHLSLEGEATPTFINILKDKR